MIKTCFVLVNIFCRALKLNEDCTTYKQDLESTKHRLLHFQSNNLNLEKDIQVLRREKDDLQTRFGQYEHALQREHII